MTQERDILLAFGGNLSSPLGGPHETIAAAAKHLASEGLSDLVLSAFYETTPVPDTGQPNFVNVAAKAKSALSAGELLQLFQNTEKRFGRQPAERWSARTLDIDLLAYGHAVLPDVKGWEAVVGSADPAAILQEPVVPHPRLHRRAFVLRPLMDIAPGWQHPVLEKTVKDLCRSKEVQAQWQTVVEKTAIKS